MRDPEYSLLTATREAHDAAVRMSNIMRGIANDYSVDEVMNGWIAIRLADGSWDGNLYDDRKAAVSHQPDPYLCCYVATRYAATGMSVEDAHTYLTFNRLAYKNGFRLPDPDAKNGGKDLIMPTPRESVRSQVHDLLIANRAVFRRPIR